MKKSELKKYVRENIISELSESTEDEINKTKELTQAVQDLESAKKQAGIEEKTANSSDDVIDPADYGVIGQNYLAGFGRENTLDLDSLEKLGRKIVKQLYKGDFAAAKAKFINEEIPNTSMLKINNVVKSASTAAKAMMDFYNQMAEKEQMDFLKNAKFKLAIDKLKDLAGDEEEAPVTEDLKEVENVSLADLEEMGYNAADDFFETKVKPHINSKIDFRYFQKGLMQGLSDASGSYGLNENEDAEPTKSDIKKTKGLAKAKEELALLTREMKSLAKKYSKAEGEDKEKLVKILKDKTKLKKELESILDNKKI